MFKLFYESPSRCADYERITSASKSDFPFSFCSLRWVENDVVVKKPLSIWPKMIEVLDFWKGLPKSKQPGWGRPGKAKVMNYYSLRWTIHLCLSSFVSVKKWQGSSIIFLLLSKQIPHWSLIVDSLENLVRCFVERFILPDVLKRASTMDKLSQLDMTNPNIQMRTCEVGFSIDHDLCQLKREWKITDFHVNTFKK